MNEGGRIALVCFDGSSQAAVAVRRGARLFPQLRAEVLHVWSPPAPTGALLREQAHEGGRRASSIDEVIEVLDKAGAAGAEQVAAKGVALAAATGWSAEPVVQRSYGGVWFDIVRIADEREAAVILVGARGLSRVRAPLGSVSDAVVHLSRRPVLVARSADGAQDPPGEGPVVIAYDGSASAQTAIESGGQLLGARSALVVHVASVPEHEERSKDLPVGARELRDGPSTPEAVAADGVERARTAGFDAAGRVERVTPPIWRRPDWGAWRTIVDIAEEEDAAVVLVGARGQSVARRVLLGSVSGGVLHHSGRSVLVVPAL